MNYWPAAHFGAVNEALEEATKKINIIYNRPTLPSNDITAVQNKIIDFLQTPNTEHLGPGPCSTLHSITLERACDEQSLEKTEFLEDSYLQYVIWIVLYLDNPTCDKGTLHRLRIDMVKNLNLLEKNANKNIGISHWQIF